MEPPPLFSKRWARNAKQQFAKGLGFLKSASGVAKGIDTGLPAFIPGANLEERPSMRPVRLERLPATRPTRDAGDNPAANASAVFQGVRQGLDMYNGMGQMKNLIESNHAHRTDHYWGHKHLDITFLMLCPGSVAW